MEKNGQLNIEIGGRYRISPSPGFQGIDKGVVRVEVILTADAVKALYSQYELEMADYFDTPGLDTSRFVVYRYVDGNDDNDLTIPFPLVLFQEHTEEIDEEEEAKLDVAREIRARIRMLDGDDLRRGVYGYLLACLGPAGEEPDLD